VADEKVKEQALLLRVRETARLINASPNTVYSMLNAGELRGVKIGKSWRVPRKAIEQLIDDALDSNGPAR